MNPVEATVLKTFLEQLVNVHEVRKDQQAASMIQRAVDQQPDAAYLLVQRALLLQEALERAKARIEQLESSPSQFPRSGTAAWTDAAAEPVRGIPATSGASVAATPPAPAGVTQSLLGRAAATAAGAAGGAFLFEGLENLVAPHAGAATGAAAAFPTEPVTVNNYYGDEVAEGGRASSDEGGTWNTTTLEDSDVDLGFDQDDDELV